MRYLLASLLVLTFFACGDSNGGATTDASPDAPSDGNTGDANDGGPDGGEDGGGDILSIYGMTCTSELECGDSGYCLGPDDDWPAGGYCTKFCDVDEDCGAGAFCSAVANGGSPAANKLCIPSCWTGDTCPTENLMCADSISAGFTDFGAEGCVPGQPVAEGVACTGFSDCRPSQICTIDQWLTPGGMCQTPLCEDADSCAPGGPATCGQFGANPTICIPACTENSNCREAEGYTCFDSENLTNGMFCAFLNPIGEACTAGTCGPAPWTCLLGQINGYCSGPLACDPGNAEDPAACPPESRCYDPTPGGATGDEYCAKKCLDVGDCRAGDGYTCADLDGAGGSDIQGCIPT